MLYEQELEKYFVEALHQQGWQFVAPKDLKRPANDVILRGRLKDAIAAFNPIETADLQQEAIKKVLSLPMMNWLDNNEIFHHYLTNGIEVAYSKDGTERSKLIWLINWTQPEKNDFVVTNQCRIKEGVNESIPDIVLYVNGLPLVVIELKNPTDKKATIEKAYQQLTNYQTLVPILFQYAGFLVVSDGLKTRAGTPTSPFQRFALWRNLSQVTEIDLNPKEDWAWLNTDDESLQEDTLTPLLTDMLKPTRVLELLKDYTVFEKSFKKDKKTGLKTAIVEKKIAGYHQYYAVEKALVRTQEAIESGSKRAGLFWHTQGSGKSLSMVFYAARLMKDFNNPTIIVITDRNDLDDQLFETFSNCKVLLNELPAQANRRNDLEDLLKVASGGIVFTTIQKFIPDRESKRFELPNEEDEDLAKKLIKVRFPKLSDRNNIIVIADEAHRTQYDFIDGYARNLRDALPNATFIGFTGTPVESNDRDTRAVFGECIDIYDIFQAVKDGATVPILYESRSAKVNLPEEQAAILDADFEKLIKDNNLSKAHEIKARWKRVEAVVGSTKRLANVAKDLLAHFDEREKVFDKLQLPSKALIVCMSRRICVELYNQIIALRPEWHTDDDSTGKIKIIMTGSSSDSNDWLPHIHSKGKRKDIGNRLKNPDDELQIVIVRDMWLTGFDAPCLATLYVDKLMQTHNLMQAIARVNRVFGQKAGGLIVDYIGIGTELREAMQLYTQSGGRSTLTKEQEDLATIMREFYDIIKGMLHGFDYQAYFEIDSFIEKLFILRGAANHILGLENGKSRFLTKVTGLIRAFSLASSHEKANGIKEEVAFFNGVKTLILKLDQSTSGGTKGGTTQPPKTSVEIEEAIRQMVEKSIESDEVIDIFDASGIKKPDVSILSDEFLAEIKNMKHRNLAIELLKKLLENEIDRRRKFSIVQSEKFSKILKETINKYHNQQLTSAQVMDELFNHAKEINASEILREQLKLTEDEYSFYSALELNESAVRELGDDILCIIAKDLIKTLKNKVSIDWNIRDDVRAELRISIKRILKRHGYPPDKRTKAIEEILKQAEHLATEELD